MLLKLLFNDGSYGTIAAIHSVSHRMHAFQGVAGMARFLAWHRAYLLEFEKLIQNASGNSKVTIPYWDWTLEPHIPGEMTNFHGISTQPRTLGKDAGRLCKGFELTAIKQGTNTFDHFTAQVETYPHNLAHQWVGGEMAIVPLAPNDPMSWLHHAQIDRIWVKSTFENT